MQENEFEKSLQQKIEKLQVQPTEQVWQNIQAQVAEKKRRRGAVVFFFMLTALIIAGLVITSITGSSDKKGLAGIGKTKEIQEKGAIKENFSLDKRTQAIPLIVEKLQYTVKANTNSIVGSTVESFNTTANKKLATSYSIRIKTKSSTKTKVVAATSDDINSSSEDETTVAVTNPVDKRIIALNEATETNAIEENKIEGTTAIKTEHPLKESGKKQAEEKISNKVGENKKKEKNKNPKWGLAASFSAGISSTGSSYLSHGLYADNLGNVPVTGSNPGTAGSYTPSKTKAGFSFTAGVHVYRQVSKSSRLMAGLQYHQIKTSIKTGQPVTQNGMEAVRVFAYGTSKNYSNRYHVLTLPINFSTTIFNIGQREICFDAGINFSRLLSTNTLSFNAAQGVYYKDETIFNKTQIGLSTAIKLNFAEKNKAAFYIGPEFNYSLTPLAASGMYSAAHSKYFGLRLQKFLKK